APGCAIGRRQPLPPRQTPASGTAPAAACWPRRQRRANARSRRVDALAHAPRRRGEPHRNRVNVRLPSQLSVSRPAAEGLSFTDWRNTVSVTVELLLSITIF